MSAIDNNELLFQSMLVLLVYWLLATHGYMHTKTMTIITDKYFALYALCSGVAGYRQSVIACSHCRHGRDETLETKLFCLVCSCLRSRRHSFIHSFVHIRLIKSLTCRKPYNNKKARVNGETDNDCINDSHKILRCR